MDDDVWNGDGKWRSIAEPLWGKNDTFHSRILSVHQAPSVIHAGSPPVCPNSDPSTCFSFSRSGLSCREPNPTSGPGGERRFCWCGQKKKKNILCFQLALSQHEMSFWQALQFRSFLLNALPQDITVKFDTGIPTLGDEFMVHSLMKTKGKKENKQAYSWSHYSPDVLNLGLEIDPSHKIWASLKQNRMFDFQDKIAHHIAYVVVTVFPKAWYRNAGGCLHMPENMIFNVNFSQVSVLIIMDLFFTLCTQLWP